MTPEFEKALAGLRAPLRSNGEKLTVVASFATAAHAVAADMLEAAGCQVRRIPVEVKKWDDAMIADYAPGADAWVGTFPSIGLPRRVIERATQTRIIVSSIIGTEMIDVGAASELGILVAHGAMVENFDGMAEAGVMLIAALIKNMRVKTEALAAGTWRPVPPGQMVAGRTIGIIGLGRIGQGIARRLHGWNCRIIAADPYVDRTIAQQLGVELMSKSDVLEQSDVVMPLVTMSDETRNLIDADAIGKMRPGSYFINLGRGGYVDEAALLAALDSGHLSGAALDTWATEPLPLDNPLRRHPKVIATGHVVGHSEELYARMPDVSAQNVLLGLAGRDPLHIRNPEVLPVWREHFRKLAGSA